MRRYGIALCLFAACVMASGVAQAVIANGPGGKLYMDSSTWQDPTSKDSIRRLTSITVNADWTVGSWVNHGTYITNKFVDATRYGSPVGDGYDGVPGGCWAPHQGNGNYTHGGLQIENSNPTGYADLMVGAYLQGNRDVTTLYPIMDVTRVVPSAGSLTQTAIGGRGSTGALGGAGGIRHTENGNIAIPDPAKGFTGPNADYVVSNHNGYYNAGFMTAANGGGVGVTNADYIYREANTKWSPIIGQDYEITGDRMFIGGYDQSYGYVKPGWGGQNIRVLQRVSDAAYTNGLWYSAAAAGFRYDLNQDTSWGYGDHGLAAGKMKGPTGAEHNAAWQMAYDDVDLQAEIVMFADLNDDGDAQDAGEAISVFSTGMSTQAWADPANWGGGYRSWDLELIQDGAKKFLMGKVMTDTYSGGYLFVMELADNGQYAGAASVDERIVQIAQATFNNPTYRRYAMIEFDQIGAAPIPEPATIFFVGTGAVGLLGWMRRRRMR